MPVLNTLMNYRYKCGRNGHTLDLILGLFSFRALIELLTIACVVLYIWVFHNQPPLPHFKTTQGFQMHFLSHYGVI